MRNEYSWSLDLNYIAHYGVAADENPPGRGSGRYPKGSGAKNGFRKITDAAVRLKKFFQKDRVNKPKEDEKLDEDELFGLVKKSLTDEFSDTEKGRMYDLLQKKYGKVTSMSDLDIEFQNARHDLAEREKSRKMGEMSNKLQDDIDANGKRTISDESLIEQWDKLDYVDRYNSLDKVSIDALETIYRNNSKDSETVGLVNEALADRFYVSDDKNAAALYKKLNQETLPGDKSEEISKQDHEAARKAALASGDRNEIMKYFNESSKDELSAAIEKANLKDSLMKSINDTNKASGESASKAADKEKSDYVKQELWSGDLNRILKVASDKSISEDELKKALNKAQQVGDLDKQLNPTNMEKLQKLADKGSSIYNTVAPIYNTLAATNNYLNPNQKMSIIPQTVDKFIEGAKNIPIQKPQTNNQPQQNQNNNQQQAQQKQNPQPAQNQPQQQAQQATPKQQQASQQVVNWLNTDVLTSPRSEKFYQSTIATLNQPIKSSSNKPIEITPSNNAYNNTSSVKWMQMTIDPSILNKKL